MRWSLSPPSPDSPRAGQGDLEGKEGPSLRMKELKKQGSYANNSPSASLRGPTSLNGAVIDGVFKVSFA